MQTEEAGDPQHRGVSVQTEEAGDAMYTHEVLYGWGEGDSLTCGHHASRPVHGLGEQHEGEERYTTSHPPPRGTGEDGGSKAAVRRSISNPPPIRPAPPPPSSSPLPDHPRGSASPSPPPPPPPMSPIYPNPPPPPSDREPLVEVVEKAALASPNGVLFTGFAGARGLASSRHLAASPSEVSLREGDAVDLSFHSGRGAWLFGVVLGQGGANGRVWKIPGELAILRACSGFFPSSCVRRGNASPRKGRAGEGAGKEGKGQGGDLGVWAAPHPKADGPPVDARAEAASWGKPTRSLVGQEVVQDMNPSSRPSGAKGGEGLMERYQRLYDEGMASTREARQAASYTVLSDYPPLAQHEFPASVVAGGRAFTATAVVGAEGAHRLQEIQRAFSLVPLPEDEEGPSSAARWGAPADAGEAAPCDDRAGKHNVISPSGGDYRAAPTQIGPGALKAWPEVFDVSALQDHTPAPGLQGDAIGPRESQAMSPPGDRGDWTPALDPEEEWKRCKAAARRGSETRSSVARERGRRDEAGPHRAQPSSTTTKGGGRSAAEAESWTGLNLPGPGQTSPSPASPGGSASPPVSTRAAPALNGRGAGSAPATQSTDGSLEQWASHRAHAHVRSTPAGPSPPPRRAARAASIHPSNLASPPGRLAEAASPSLKEAVTARLQTAVGIHVGEGLPHQESVDALEEAHNMQNMQNAGTQSSEEAHAAAQDLVQARSNGPATSMLGGAANGAKAGLQAVDTGDGGESRGKRAAGGWGGEHHRGRSPRRGVLTCLLPPGMVRPGGAGK